MKIKEKLKKLRYVLYRSMIIILLVLFFSVPLIIFALSGSYMGFIIGLFFSFPFVLTVLNIFFIFGKRPSEQKREVGQLIEYITVILGISLSVLFIKADFTNIAFGEDWYEQLYNSTLHAPIFTESWRTVIAFALTAVGGWLVLRILPQSKLPPLLSVLCISAMYIGIALCIVWVVQVSNHIADVDIIFLILLPVNCILIAVKVVRELTLARYQDLPDDRNEPSIGRYPESPLLYTLDKLLRNSLNWPWIALILALPLSFALLAILTLFGQRPDSIIKAFTETADWSLSKRIGPQNLYYDEHYLCTVAAGGHEKVVKPLRLGERHGHKVIVNRQLLVANSFEQLLEERLPRFHRVVRKIYDKTGYPIARHIHSPIIADSIYIMMKPAEWLFILALYLFDAKPENRIAVQYLPDEISAENQIKQT